MNRGIQGAGVYLPRPRLQRAAVREALAWLSQHSSTIRGQRTYCQWDEDSLTMAVEAGRACLTAPGASRPAALSLASTTLPFADRSNAGVVAAALGLVPACRTSDATGSLRAGTTALRDAIEGITDTLVIASDARRAKPGSPQELAYGHGAAALAVGSENLLAEYSGGESTSVDFVDHHRAATAEFDYAYEERWIREEGYQKLIPPVVQSLLKRVGVDPTAIMHTVIPLAGSFARRVAIACGLKVETVRDSLHEHCGDTGSAHTLLMLADALAHASAGDWLLAIGFGEGVDALLFRATDTIAASAGRKESDARVRNGSSATGLASVAVALASGRADSAYTRYLAHSGLLQVESGMRAERDARTAQPVAYRKRADITSFIGGRCARCDTVQFPRTRVCVNPECRSMDTQVEHRLADTVGSVKTFTEDWLAYSPNPPLIYGNIDIGGGGNVFMEITDADPGELAVGTPVRMMFRVKDVDRLRNYRRYFWKAAPLRS